MVSWQDLGEAIAAGLGVQLQLGAEERHRGPIGDHSTGSQKMKCCIPFLLRKISDVGRAEHAYLYFCEHCYKWDLGGCRNKR